MIHKAMIYPKFWAYSFFFFWRKALGHEVIIYPNFWGQNSKIIFKSKRAQDHEYVIGFIEKMLNPSVLWESFETLKPKDRGRLTKSPIRIKRGNLFELIDQTLWTRGKAHLWMKDKNGSNFWTRGKALMGGERQHSRWAL